MSAFIRFAPKSLVIRLSFCALMCMPAISAQAYIECTVTPVAVISTDEGNVYVYYTTPGIGQIFHTDADFKMTSALALSAILTDRHLIVRYPDGRACTDIFVPILGVQLTK